MLDFETIYRRYWPDVMRFSLYLCGNTAEAEDLAATAFLRAWTSIRTVRLPTVKAYLFVIVRNLYRDHLRQEARRRTRQIPDSHPDPGCGPAVQAAQHDDLERTLSALQQLRENDREILSMAAVDGMPHVLIAAARGTSVAAVKVQLHRARARLSEILQKTRSES